MKLEPSRRADERGWNTSPGSVPRRVDVLDAFRAFTEATNDGASLLDTIVERVTWLFGDGCILAKTADGERCLVPSAVHFRDPDLLDAARVRLGIDAPHPDGVPDVSTVDSVPLDDRLGSLSTLPSDRSLPPACIAALVELGVGCVSAVPLRIGDHDLGVLLTMRLHGADRFNDREEDLLQLIAVHAALAIRNAQLKTSLEECSRRSAAERDAGRVPGSESSTRTPRESPVRTLPAKTRRAEAETSGRALFGAAPSMRSVRESAELALTHSEPVLLLGNTGTGKGYLAQWIRDRGPRARAPFVAINCSSLNEGLLMSELFGSSKGAYTTAVRDRKGLIEEADGGTLFLDEIGDMNLAAQIQLLKVLEEKRFRRVGETVERRSDFRLICATNRDLRAEVVTRRFREDLYYRISVFSIALPDLRDRIADLPELARSILEAACAPETVLPEETIALLSYQPWPGNIRELRNVLIRALVLARGRPLAPEFFTGLEPPPASALEAVATRERAASEPGPSREHLAALLEQYKGNRSQLAKALYISRTTLYRYLERHGLTNPSA